MTCRLMLLTSYLKVVGSYNPDARVIGGKDLPGRIDGNKIYHLWVPVYNYAKHASSLTNIRECKVASL